MRTFKYQNKKNKNYFEGWYFRVTTSSKNYGVIFAITKNEQDPHAFIQFFTDEMDRCLYLRYDSSEFSFKDNTVYIGDNYLSLNELQINSEDLKIKLEIKNHLLYTKNNKVQSAMSYLENAPLECFQEVLYLKAFATGEIQYKNEINTIEGSAYSEKTYGKNFPKQWIWLQSYQGAPFTFSMGKMPVGPFNINGFFFIMELDNQLLRFSTTNGAKIKFNTTKMKADIFISKGFYRIHLEVNLLNPIQLVGPAKYGKMSLGVQESLSSITKMKVFYKGLEKYSHTYKNCGFENMY